MRSAVRRTGTIRSTVSRIGGRTTVRSSTTRSVTLRTTAWGSRTFYNRVVNSRSTKYYVYPLVSGVVIGTIGLSSVFYASNAQTNWDEIRGEVKALLNAPGYDDGSYGPLFVRLAWHAAGTYDVATKTGGSNGGTMRFHPESGHGANAGLKLARDLLEPIKKKHPEISYGDLWTLAGCVAIEAMGGPHIPWRPGRTDAADGKACPPDGRLPDASKDRKHVRDIFYRMGFNDREIVALLGAHSLGRCHTDRSGYHGPWTTSPTTFSNEFYTQLLEAEWKKKNWTGPTQFEDSTGTLMMLPTDLELVNDPEFRKYVELYAKDEKVFFQDFAAAFSKMMELGVCFPSSSGGGCKPSIWKRIFG